MVPEGAASGRPILQDPKVKQLSTNSRPCRVPNNRLLRFAGWAASLFCPGEARWLSRLRCHGHSLLLSSYLHRISRKENSDCSACGHPLQDLNHLLLDCPASEPLRKSIFGSSLYSRSMVQTLGYGPTVGSPRSSSAPPSLGRGRVEPPPPPDQI